jgi:glutamate 5-kinase
MWRGGQNICRSCRYDSWSSPEDELLTVHQALAAIGQCRLMSLWDSLFAHLNQPIAQILLTRNDIADVSEQGKPTLRPYAYT